jgi:hypothetical protein
VACSHLDISIPVGDGAAELTTAPELITVTVSGDSRWRVTSSGNGHFTAAPASGEPVGKGVTLTFLIAGVVINTVTGTSVVTVTKVTDPTRRSQLQVTKVAGSDAVSNGS